MNGIELKRDNVTRRWTIYYNGVVLPGEYSSKKEARRVANLPKGAVKGTRRG